MKKTKPAAIASEPDVQTFGGDYHKCESTFAPRNPPAAVSADTKRKSSSAGKAKRKNPRGA